MEFSQLSDQNGSRQTGNNTSISEMISSCRIYDNATPFGHTDIETSFSSKNSQGLFSKTFKEDTAITLKRSDDEDTDDMITRKLNNLEMANINAHNSRSSS